MANDRYLRVKTNITGPPAITQEIIPLEHLQHIENMDKRTGARTMIEKYNKITPGFVTQVFQKNEKFICVEQHFTAGDPVDRENEKGEPVDIDIREEQYQPFDMVQPNNKKRPTSTTIIILRITKLIRISINVWTGTYVQ